MTDTNRQSAIGNLRSETPLVRVGTSGYQFDDWVGPWYPEGTIRRQMLAHYVSRFDVLEINSTYYGPPRLSMTRRLAEETPEGFGVVLKAYKGMTHQFEGWEVYNAFRQALVPLQEAGKLLGLLFQFPASFENDPKRRAYLRRLPELLPDCPLIVEFRHRKWIVPEVSALLREAGISYCCVDEPDLPQLVPPIARVTSPLGYLRLHSRDRELWYRGARLRYDYDYSDSELAGWVAKIRPLLRDVKSFLVFFNNCARGQAAHNAERFKQLLSEAAQSPP